MLRRRPVLLSAPLGHLLWFTIERAPEGEPGRRLTREDVLTWFREAGLSTEHLPPEPTPLEAFRDASSRTVTYTDGGVTFTLGVEETHADDRMVVRSILCHHRAGGRPRTVKTGELVFTRPRTRRGVHVPGTEGWRHRISPVSAPPGSSHREHTQALVDAFSADYVKHNRTLYADAVRRAFYLLLDQADAVLVRHGTGFWFVEDRHADLPAGMTYVADRLGAPSVVHTVPVPDSARHRAMVDVAFCDQLVRDATRLAAQHTGAAVQAGAQELLEQVHRYARRWPQADVTRAATAVERLLS